MILSRARQQTTVWPLALAVPFFPMLTYRRVINHLQLIRIIRIAINIYSFVVDLCNFLILFHDPAEEDLHLWVSHRTEFTPFSCLDVIILIRMHARGDQCLQALVPSIYSNKTHKQLYFPASRGTSYLEVGERLLVPLSSIISQDNSRQIHLY